MINIARAGSAQFETIVAKLLHRGATDLDAVEPTVREHPRRGEGAAATTRSAAFTEHFEDAARPLFSRATTTAPARSRACPAAARGARARGRRASPATTSTRSTTASATKTDGVRSACACALSRASACMRRGAKRATRRACSWPRSRAQVAGVKDIILATPAPGRPHLRRRTPGRSHRHSRRGRRASHRRARLRHRTVPKVDKIVGPGNLYVTAPSAWFSATWASTGSPARAKSWCSATPRRTPRWVAADLLSQAEHDEAAYALCITTDAELATRDRARGRRAARDPCRDEHRRGVDRATRRHPRRELAR